MANPWGVPVGYGAGTGMTSVDQVRTEARWAESAGFDSFWVSQIFGVDGQPAVGFDDLPADIGVLPPEQRSERPEEFGRPGERSVVGLAEEAFGHHGV